VSGWHTENEERKKTFSLSLAYRERFFYLRSDFQKKRCKAN